MLELDGEAGTFIFNYPDGNSGRYTIATSFKSNRGVVRARPVREIEMPSGYSMVGFSGLLSKDGKTISGSMQRCGKFRVARGTTAPGSLTNGDTETSSKSDNLPVRRNGSTKGAAGRLPQGAFQDADAKCQTGPMVVRVEFHAADKDGFDTTIHLRRKRFASFTEFRGRAEQDGRRIVIQAETKTDGPYQGIGFDLVLNGGTRQDGPFKAVADELQCYGIYLRPTAEPAPGKQQRQAVPPQYQSFAGIFDGAVYQGEFMGAIPQNIDQRVTQVTPLSLEVSPSATGGAGRMFDVALSLGDKRYAYALVEDKTIAREGLALVPAEAEEPYPKKGPVPYTSMPGRRVDALSKGSLQVFADGGPTDWVAKGRLFYSEAATGGVISLKRRPVDQKKSLASVCAEDLRPLVATMGAARNTARELKINLYPALNAFDAGRAAMIETALSARQRQGAGNIDIARLAFECSLTGSSMFQASDGTLSQDLFSPEGISKALYKVVTWYSDGAQAVDYPDPLAIPANVEAINAGAEAKLEEIVRATQPMTVTADILAYIGAQASGISDARPSIMSEKLAPILARLAEIGVGEQEGQAAGKREAARQKMAGIRVPYESIGPHRLPLLNAITSGEARNLTGDDKLFLSGILAYTGETCGQPAPDVRLRLLGLLLQGTQLLTGLDFDQQGGVGDILTRSLQRQAGFAEGSLMAKSIGCGSDYLAAMFELLASGSTDTERPSLLVRSCTLDRPPGQCACIEGVARQVFPDIAETRYSRSVISQTISRAPGIALQFATLCGIMNY